MTGCLDDNTMAAYFDGVLDTADVATIEAHVSECAACRKDLSAMAVAHTLGGSRDDGADGGIIPGDRIGRYVLAEERARGAMGIVASARDPELGREVAIKVLRPEVSAHLLRQEARAMAKLSHPNVVSVYDVGEHAGRVYLAMELVDGIDLRRWLGLERRGWRTVLRACIVAGRGLAAAHRAGLVHRDVKPDNILCGPEDRVRITDFGLAESATADVIGITGTPAYIAPEVWRREPATTRSDQWSFCATAYEALFGVTPFVGDTTQQLRDAIDDGRLELPARPPVPRRLKRALARGLARDPAARHGSMDALLAELEAVLRPVWPWIALGAGLVAVTVGVTAFALHSTPADLCRLPASSIQIAWDAPAIERAFAASGRKHAATSARRVREIFDGYAQGWLAMRIDACRATRVRGDQSEALLDARVRCLDRRRDELAALATALADHPTPESVDRAVSAALGLSSIESCASSAVASDAAAPPAPSIALQVAAIDRELAQVRAAALVSPRVEATVERARGLVAQARALGYPPLVARAVQILASLSRYSKNQERTEHELDEALVATAAARDDLGSAQIWVDRLNFTAHLKGDPARALELVPAAEAAVIRAGAPGVLRAGLLHAHASALSLRGEHEASLRLAEQARELEPRPTLQAKLDLLRCTAERALGRFPAARDHCAAALATLERELGRDHPEIASALMDIGATALALDDRAGARAAFERSASLFAAASGEAGLPYAMAQHNLGLIAAKTGELDDARRHFERALATLEPLGHIARIQTLQNLALVENTSGNRDKAGTLLARALELATTAYGPASVDRARLLLNAAGLAVDRSDLDDADADYTRALDIMQKLGGDATPLGATAISGLAIVAETRGDCRKAIVMYTRASIAHATMFGATDDSVASDLTGVGRCQLTLGDAGAVATLERALAIHDGHPALEPYEPAATRFDLARALWQHGGSRARPRALTLAREARAKLASAASHAAGQLVGEIDRWLAARGAGQPSGP